MSELKNLSIKIDAVVQLPDGSLRHFGNTELGFSVFKNLEQTKRRSSLDWVPVTPLPKQQTDLSMYFKIQAKVSDLCDYTTSYKSDL